MKPLKEINFKEASTYYLVGNFFNKGISFITVPIFTRILSTMDYGIVTTFNSWVSILSMIFGFAIYMGIRAAFIDFEKQIDTIMSVCTTFTIFSSIPLGIFIMIILYVLRVNIDFLLIILCMIQGVATAVIQNYSIYLMMLYKYKLRTLIMILPNLISAILSIFTILIICNKKYYWGRIIPTTIVYFFISFILLILIYKKSKVLYSGKYLSYALKISLPLVIHGISLYILSQSDLTMITWLAGSSQTGVYSLIYNFSMIAVVITTALDGIWIPWFTNQLKQRYIDGINEKAVYYIKLMTIAMVGVILTGPEIVKLLADEKYQKGIIIIPPIVLANYVVFAYTMYVNIEHFYKKTFYITLNTIIAALSNILLNYILIPYFGYMSAAFTTLISYLISFLLHVIYAKKLEPELYPLKTFLGPFAQIIVIVFIFYKFINIWYIRWGLAFIYCIIFVFINRKNIYKIFFIHTK